MAPTVWSIVVAAGSGRRFDPVRLKQHETFGDARVQDVAMDAARTVASGVVLVTLPELAGDPDPRADVVVAGGATRSASVRCGLAVVPDDCDIVVVHDGARPVAHAPLFEAVVAAVTAGADAAVPGVAVADTLKRVEGDRVVETVARDDLVAVQTPQAFRLAALRAAHAAGGEASDDAALIEAAGGRVVVVPGDPDNLKITTKADLSLAWMLLQRSRA
jgi:2-C-methyl-D-erythritol 4-phosphate cytidylyltransferase